MTGLVNRMSVYDHGSLISDTKHGYDEFPLQPSGISTKFETNPIIAVWVRRVGTVAGARV